MDAVLLGGLMLSSSVFAWTVAGWSREELGGACARVRLELEGVGRAARELADRVRYRLRPSRGADASQSTLAETSEMVDIVRLGLSAGLSFDAALGLYCEHRNGAVSARLARARALWQIGAGSRGEELLACAHDLGLRALESFAVAVSQGLALGAPLADTLGVQSREMRLAHRAQVEREIERAPVKLLIPTGTLILPALLLSILGPLLSAGGML